jgi:hypothetical protein
MSSPQGVQVISAPVMLELLGDFLIGAHGFKYVVIFLFSTDWVT